MLAPSACRIVICMNYGKTDRVFMLAVCYIGYQGNLLVFNHLYSKSQKQTQIHRESGESGKPSRQFESGRSVETDRLNLASE